MENVDKIDAFYINILMKKSPGGGWLKLYML